MQKFDALVKLNLKTFLILYYVHLLHILIFELLSINRVISFFQ